MNSTLDFILRILPLLIPILLIQVALMVYSLIDLSRRDGTRGPKWLWIIIIVFGELWGPIVYLVYGRVE